MKTDLEVSPFEIDFGFGSCTYFSVGRQWYEDWVWRCGKWVLGHYLLQVSEHWTAFSVCVWQEFIAQRLHSLSRFLTLALPSRLDAWLTWPAAKLSLGLAFSTCM